MKQEQRTTDDTVEQEEVRPGLVMRARRVLKEDGRYLWYFEFEREPGKRGGGTGDAQ